MARVVFVTDGTPLTQSVVHRVGYTARFLSDRGHHVRIFYGREQRIFGRRFARMTFPSFVRTILAVPTMDVLVVHRAADPLLGVIVSLAKWTGKRLVTDLDDAVYLNRNPLTFSINYLLRSSDLVSASSRAIARYASRCCRNVQIVPAIVDTILFAPRQRSGESSVPTIGWLGDGRVHSENLRVLVDPLLSLAKKVKFKLKLVSALGNERIFDAFKEVERHVEVDYGPEQWVEISRIPGMIEDFDISVMPLVDNAFSRAKAGQKILESMSMGFPIVASAVGENRLILSHGTDGFLAESAEDWVRYLGQLIRDPGLRERMGAEGRRKVVTNYSREVCGELFAGALEVLLA